MSGLARNESGRYCKVIIATGNYSLRSRATISDAPNWAVSEWLAASHDRVSDAEATIECKTPQPKEYRMPKWLRVVFVLLMALTGGIAAGQGGSAKLYLPMIRVPEPPPPLPAPQPLYPADLGEPLPVAGASAFFADQLFSSDNDISLWLPPNQPVIRGIVINNGVVHRPNSADPDWRNQVAQNRELAGRQLASTWGFAYLSGGLWDDARRNYALQEAYLHAELARFAQITGHSELLNAPFVIIGNSRNASFGNLYAMAYPERVIAYTIVVADSAGVAPEVPGLIIVGERDRGAEIIAGSVKRDRAAGALIAGAIIWGEGHVCDRCGDLAWPFFDEMIRARLPADADLRNGWPTLLPLDPATAFLGNMQAWDGSLVPANGFSGDPSTMAWLPNLAVAQAWAGFVQRSPPAKLLAPSTSYSWSNGFTQEPAPLYRRKLLEVHTRTAFPVTFSLNREPVGNLALSLDGQIFAAVAYDSATKQYRVDLQLPVGMYNVTVLENGAPISWPAGLVVMP